LEGVVHAPEIAPGYLRYLIVGFGLFGLIFAYFVKELSENTNIAKPL
jgi:hypothetical protein